MTEKITCIHCGDVCGKYPVMWEDKPFCCHGCKTVYQLLSDNRLYKYYEIENTPGIREKQTPSQSRYAFLDQEDIQAQLLDFNDGKIAKVNFYIPSIHCSSCIWLLENLSRLHKGVISSMVNFPRKEARIIFKSEEISLRQLVELLASIHYIPQLSPAGNKREERIKRNRILLLKIGVAGFAFGNIMLFSMPAYVPGKELLEEPLKNFFAWLNFGLSIPVVFFSGSEYLISAWKNLIRKNVNINLPIALGILALLIQSSYEVIFTNGHGYFDSLSGFVFFMLIGKWYQAKTFKALSFERDYKSYFPVSVTRMEGGQEKIIPLMQVKEHDVIRIRNQELIPADALLIKGEALIDYSFVTGESKAVTVHAGEEIFAGGRLIGSLIEVKVNKEVEQSKLTRLWNEDIYSKEDNTRLETLIDKVSRHFVVIVIFIALFTALFWLWKDPSKALFAATSVLIIACPCALALSMPFAYGNAMRLLSRKSFFLKKATVVEKLADTDCVVFDKTGTITIQGMHDVAYYGEELDEEDKKVICALSGNSAHPLSIAIHHHFSEYRGLEVMDFREIPSEGIKGRVGNIEVSLGAASFVGYTGVLPEEKASSVFYAINNKIKGYFAICITYRDKLTDVLHELAKKYDLHLISGDNDAERPFLAKFFKPENMHFNLSPENKLKYIGGLKKEGRKVLMIGDGLNDAGALRESHTGVSIADDVYRFTPASDAIMEGKNFLLLPFYLQFSQTAIRILKWSLFISFVYNVVGLSIAVQAILSPVIAAIIMPLSSVSVVAFAILTSGSLFHKKFNSFTNP